MNKIWLVPVMVSSAIVISPSPTANAGLCDYPAVLTGSNVFVAQMAYCDWPTEINGSHMHCEGGGVGVDAGAAFGGGATLGLGGLGVGGVGCSWRCPDNTGAPAPNPPGAWKWYMVPVPNACKDHMEPFGYATAPVLPGEGMPVPAPPPAAVGGPVGGPVIPPLAPETELP
jgi:hypothetical protein